jgi:ADP-heptose:LPS heptosyltransferase
LLPTRPSDRDRIKAQLGQASSVVEVPVVYIGEGKTIDVNVKGIFYTFVRGVPRVVPIPVANILSNRGNFKHLSDVDTKLYQDPKKWVKSILIARTLHSIGDMLMATPTPKALRQKYPGAHISVAVPRASFPIWFHHPFVNDLIAWEDIRGPVGRKYELYFDITRPCVRYEMANHPSRKQRIDIYIEHCGASLPNEEKQPIYTITQEEREWAHEVTGGRFFFGVQLRANAPIRNWMAGNHCPQDRNKEIARRWLGLDNGIDIMLFDEHKELSGQYPGARIFKRPGSSIRQVFALAERCAMMMTLDSGLLHGCGALSIPVVALFGNIHPDSRTTYYKDATGLFRPEACPQNRAPCNGDCGHQHCLEGITIDEVWAALQKKWDLAGKRRLEILKGHDSMNRGPIGREVEKNGADDSNTAA